MSPRTKQQGTSSKKRYGKICVISHRKHELTFVFHRSFSETQKENLPPETFFRGLPIENQKEKLPTERTPREVPAQALQKNSAGKERRKTIKYPNHYFISTSENDPIISCSDEESFSFGSLEEGESQIDLSEFDSLLRELTSFDTQTEEGSAHKQILKKKNPSKRKESAVRKKARKS